MNAGNCTEDVSYVLDYVHKSYAENSLLLFTNIFSPNQHCVRMVNLRERRLVRLFSCLIWSCFSSNLRSLRVKRIFESKGGRE